MRRSTEGPSTVVSPSSSIPSSAKNALAASRSSTTMRTLSIRSNLFFVIVIKLLYLRKSSQAAREAPHVQCIISWCSCRTLCWAFLRLPEARRAALRCHPQSLCPPGTRHRLEDGRVHPPPRRRDHLQPFFPP